VGEVVEPITSMRKLNNMKLILKDHNLRDYCCFVVGINIPLRIGDLVRFNIGDVVDRKGNVKEMLDTIQGKSLRQQKTKKSGRFKINKAAREAIEEYLQTREPYELSDPLFVSRKRSKDGKLAHVNTFIVYKNIKNAAEDVGLEHIGAHSMRKTWGYWAVKKGIPIRHIQKALSHSSERETLGYIGITQEELNAIMDDHNL
jgi:integrase